jgi:hypothetical protein
LNVKDFRNLFVVCSLVLVFFVISPTLNLFFPFYIEDSFSELSLLGPNHMAKDYPFNVVLNNKERLFVKVDNHMGESAYYRVCVKFRNQTQSSPSEDEPSLLAPLYEFRVFLLDGGSWEDEVKFNFLETLNSEDTVQVKKLMINNVIFDLDSLSSWDSEYQGFYYQLFFELWYYDFSLHRFNYYDQGFVGVWLNMTI